MSTQSNLTAGLTAAIYTRISSDPDGTALGVARQEKDCRALCATHGWKVGAVFQDNDLSAYKSTVIRPAFQAMLKAAESGNVQALVVYDADRMTRQPVEWEQIIGLVDRKGTALATCSGDLDLSTDQGQFMARIMGATARKSSDDTRRRIKRKKVELAAAGKYGGGGLRAYGYADDRVSVVPAEGAIIREMVRRVLSGDTVTGIAGDLDRRGVRTVGSKPWRTNTIRAILQSGRIAGRREVGTGEDRVDMAEAVWPAIVSLKDVKRIRGLFSERDPKERTVRTYSLTGLLFCGNCGAPMRGTGLHHGKRRYGCVKDQGTVGHCAKTFIQADGIERFIRDDALGQLVSMTNYGTRGAAVAGSDEIQTRLEANQRKLGQLFKDSGDIPAADFEAARDNLKAEIATAKAALAQQSPQSIALIDLLGAGAILPAGTDTEGLTYAASRDQREWDRLEPARQRAILGLVYQRILIGPGRPGRNPKGRFPAERVTTVYANGTSYQQGQRVSAEWIAANTERDNAADVAQP